MASKQIGQLNGKWSVLLRMQLAIAVPLLITLETWQTVQIWELRNVDTATQGEIQAFMAQGPRYTAVDAKVDIAAAKLELMAWVGSHYPPDWLEEDLKEIKATLIRLENHTH